MSVALKSTSRRNECLLWVCRPSRCRDRLVSVPSSTTRRTKKAAQPARDRVPPRQQLARVHQVPRRAALKQVALDAVHGLDVHVAVHGLGPVRLHELLVQVLVVRVSARAEADVGEDKVARVRPAAQRRQRTNVEQA